MTEPNSEGEASPKLSFAKQVLVGRKDSSVYLSTAFIPPTTVIVESLFSVAGWTWSDRRASTLPVHVEEQMFLHTNKDYWDVGTLERVLLTSPEEELQ